MRIAWTACWGVVVVLFVALWVRSYWWADFTHRSSPSNICSIQGKLLFGCTLMEVGIRNPTPARTANPPKMASSSFAGLYPASMSDWIFTFANDGIAVPYWICVLSASAVASAAWLNYRFSLRTLLSATTVFAVVLGFVVWAVIK